MQMMGAGRQCNGIIISGGASLSLTGEPAQRPVWSVFLVGLLADPLEIGLTPAVFGLALTTLHGGWTCLRCRMVAVARLAPCRWK